MQEGEEGIGFYAGRGRGDTRILSVAFNTAAHYKREQLRGCIWDHEQVSPFC
jgi:hypothetical protein